MPATLLDIAPREVAEALAAFGNRVNLTLHIGEVGFGRPCVGFLTEHGNYVDYNPPTGENYDYPFGQDHRLDAPNDVVDAYHKHDCLCVLVRNDDLNEAARQLLLWVRAIESHGSPTVQSFPTGKVGIQAMFSGTTSYAITVPKP